MQTVSELMTRDARFVAPQESLQRAAQMMDELDVGALPVCENGRLVGMVTDRDITIRATAAGKSPQEAHVDEVMSTDVRWCFEDQPLDEVMMQMADNRIRRVPVVSHDDPHKLIGIVSLGDVATRTPGAQKTDVEHAVEMVSSPSEPGSAQAGANDAASRTGEVPGGAAAIGTDSAGAAGYAAGSEGFAGTEEPTAPVASSARTAAEQRNDSAGSTRHVGQMPQDTSGERPGGTPTSDAMGTAMQPERQDDAGRKPATDSAALQSQPDVGRAADGGTGVGGTAAAVGAAGGTNAAAGAHMAGGPPAKGSAGAPGGAATAGTTEPGKTVTAGGGSAAAGAVAAGGTSLGGADMGADAGAARAVPREGTTGATGGSGGSAGTGGSAKP